MWYLIAFVVCLDVALAKSPRCLCPKTEKLDPSVLDFIVTAEISYVVGRDEDGFLPYGINNTRVIKPANSTHFNSRVYTKGEGEWFGVTLNPGTRFILEGMIRIGAVIDGTPLKKFF
ncbi:hypothetical protein ANCCAN_09668 [Ancylostoma caninum]|uniref:Uncharacterized protein n=1 Tax=Ancylostoma caninum TaxID=29170 RepID=A0A368GIY4_ANCCA|nr:hypothetical protein ANCCAN_09668 [Ancylostoma caninum]